MAENKKISQFIEVESVDNTTMFPIIQGGPLINAKISAARIGDFIGLDLIKARLQELELQGIGGGDFRLDDWQAYDEAKKQWVLSAGLGKDLLDRVEQVEIQDSDKHYQTNINMPSLIWNITHNLNKYPAITVLDNDMQEVVGGVEYIDLNRIRITFSAEFSGKVLCN